MRNLVVGMLTGSCVTLACVFGYQYAVRSSNTSVPARHETDRTKEAPKAIKAEAPRSTEIVSGAETRRTNEKNLTELLIQEVLAIQDNQETVKDVEGKSETIAAIEALAQYNNARRRSVGRDLQQKIEELKKKGREIVPDLVKVLNGSGSQESKILAASILGAINADLQDPEISDILSSQALPMLEEIITGKADMRLKRQAITALGEINDEASVKILVGIVTRETDRSLKGYASEAARSVKRYASDTLSRKGTVDSAYQLLSTIRGLDDDAELLLTVNCIAQINARTQDPNLANRLDEAVPRLQEIVNNANESRRNNWMALSTLGSIGSVEANQVLMKLVKGGENVNDRFRRSAIRTVSRSGGPDLAEGLGEILQIENDASRQIDLASAIVSIANRNPYSTAATVSKSEAMPALYRLASSSKSVETQRRAISTIGRIGGTHDIETLRQLGESNEKLKMTVNEAIGRIERRAEGGDSNTRSGRFRSGRFWGR